jgi:FemAB-related protein (PEP-CTERM system-associated)
VKHDWKEVALQPPGGLLQVGQLAPADATRWDAFVEGCPAATFFHRIGWKAVLESVFGYRTLYLYAERGGEIVGVLPLAQIKSWLFGHALVSLPFCVYGGVAVQDPQAAPALVAEAERLAELLGAQRLELRHCAALNPAWPRQDLYVTFRRPILPEVEANMLAIPRKQRAMVRKGASAGLRSELDPGIDRFFRLYADNVHRHGTPALPKRYFETLQRAFGADCEVLTVVDASGTAVSSVLSFYFRDQVLPYYAGDLPRARELAANDFKYWEVMRRACERGCRIFDYGRSKRNTGAYDFKRNWGFEPIPLHYEHRLFGGASVPQHNPANPRYKGLMALWRRLPLPVANALGPCIVRGLG